MSQSLFAASGNQYTLMNKFNNRKQSKTSGNVMSASIHGAVYNVELCVKENIFRLEDSEKLMKYENEY